MISVRGVYDGNAARPLEDVNAEPNSEVIITFLGKRQGGGTQPSLLDLAGTWEDDRSADEIVRDIYDSRSSSDKEIDL